MPRFRFRPDTYTLLLVGMVVLATLLPVEGKAAVGFGWATKAAIALLFFLHGARLSRAAVVAGATHWRLHLLIFAGTFVLFPALGVGIYSLPAWILPPALGVGMLFLCCLPSTVQSSIAFTSIAGGNVPAAVCSASVSNMVGVFLTPLLAGLLLSVSGSDGIRLDSIEAIVLQLLVPFVIGQILQPWIGDFVRGHKKLVMVVDRGSILMVVYGAFSEAVIHGLWHTLPLDGLAVMIGINMALLAVVMVTMTVASRKLGFSREDEIAIVFCGSKKSLASGIPIANALFAGPQLGMIVLPVMFFHQIQLMVCAVLARHYAETAPQPTPAPIPSQEQAAAEERRAAE
ncbi:Sodium - Bile acid symporter [Rhodovulum sp. PH10]|uniref:bile acid:sodium symporter family protein n=1 Tax=Rhodovulum sp. PH10 TaxID=1187851 RepID=UPI00027C22E4|nr:bile acid:sodium symporter family protein [Rhodovulum sp. PH10]EJW13332.1 Sodium - Bile acid symporter [Rhodovulum sp. PH10]